MTLLSLLDFIFLLALVGAIGLLVYLARVADHG